MIKKGWTKILILFVIAILLRVISFFPSVIEQFYTGHAYALISSFLRFITGWVPFSLGDVLYALFVIWIALRIYKVSRAAINRMVTRDSFLRSLQRTIAGILWIYIIFSIFWGLNYYRRGIAYQLQLQPGKYDVNDLKNLTHDLIIKVNSSRLQLPDSAFIYPSNKVIFDEAKQAYFNAKKKYPFLRYSISSVKSSVYGEVGNYLGLLGYYNPLTGEAQVNTTVPAFLIPYTTCHEMAHQLGYATEDEANFAGYLAARSSEENTFTYSVYLDLFSYANRQLFARDSVAARENYKLLDTLVKKDIVAYRKFLQRYQNKIEPFIRILYGEYLKANNQPKGMETYDEVVAWLIAYRKKYGEL